MIGTAITIIIFTTIFTIIFCVICLCRLNRLIKGIEDLKDNQFDAEQVMKLYAKKYEPKPQIIHEKKELVPVYAYYELPHFAEEKVTEDEIERFLAKELAKEIPKYMEIVSDRDIQRLCTMYRARIMIARVN